MSRNISKKELIAMDRTAVSIKGVLDDLRTQISILDDDIKVRRTKTLTVSLSC